MPVPNLAIEGLELGSHREPFDLTIWAYRGGVQLRPAEAKAKIRRGELSLEQSRLPVLEGLHAHLQAMVVKGSSFETVQSIWHLIKSFFSWAEFNSKYEIELHNLEPLFLDFAEHLRHRSVIENTISENYVYGLARRVSRALLIVVDGDNESLRHNSMKNPWMEKTRLRLNRRTGSKNEKISIGGASEQAKFMVDLCNVITAPLVTGQLPVTLTLPNGAEKRYPAKKGNGRKPIGRLTRERAKPLKEPKLFQEHRDRISLANLRIEFEFCIFIVNTGMNVSQALRLKRDNFRWQTDGDDVKAFKVYKNRRHGDAVFRAFKEYRAWLKKYCDWLDELEIEDERLFPFIYSSKVPASNVSSRGMLATKSICELARVHYESPKALRKVRQNWLLRAEAGDKITALAGAHAEPTLLRFYEEPNHNAASVRIGQFHATHDPSLSPDSGICSVPGNRPEPVEEIPEQAPEPDCISPEGCLFCVHHRDVDSFDYVWSLASHRWLKSVERDNYERPIDSKKEVHPADVAIDLMTAKLNEFSRRGGESSRWVTEAENRVREWRFHPRWDGFIRLFDSLEGLDL